MNIFLFKRRGIILYLVLFVAMILTILAVQFQRSASHVQFSGFRSEEDEAIRQIAQSAIEELFLKVWEDSEKSGTSIRNMLLHRTTTPIKFSLADFPLTKAHSKGPRGYLTPQVEGEVKLFDSRQTSSSLDQKYYKDESVGTVELMVKASYQTTSVAQSSLPVCVLARHHDYKVTSLVTSPLATTPQRNAVYAQNHLLDYLLFVRDGLREFRSAQGASLNNQDIRLSLQQASDPNRPGKVFFGGTGPDGPAARDGEYPKGNYVFLNTTTGSPSQSIGNTEPLLPSPGKHPDEVVDWSVVFRLRPDILAALKKKKEAELAKYPDDTDEVEKESAKIEAKVKKIKGQFHMIDLPVQGLTDTTLASISNSALNLLRKDAEGSEKNIAPGIEIVSTEGSRSFDSTVLEGDIRQRFLHLVYFDIDDSEDTSGIFSAATLADFSRQRPCVIAGPNALAAIDTLEKPFYEELKKYEQDRVASGLISVVSTFSAEFPLRKGLTNTLKNESITTANAFPQPAFVDTKGASCLDATAPFSLANLFALDVMEGEALQSVGIWQPEQGKLNLRGLVRVEGDLVLGKSGKKPLVVYGQGGIICGGKITIACEIKKNTTDDFCILMSRKGVIDIQTPEKIQAALISMNNEKMGMVTASALMNLQGLLVVDRLGLPTWAKGHHIIEYDPCFKRTDDVYKIVISRQITLQRMTGGL